MIHAMMTVRNEGTRLINGVHAYEQVLINMCKLCDTITIIDDNSSDDTVSKTMRILKSQKFDNHRIIINNENLWESNEVELRKQLFNETIKQAKNNDWLICLDADELLVEEHIDYLKYLLGSLSTEIDAIGFKLFDMWSNTHYRHDNYWLAHLHFFPMAVRYKADFNYIWNNKALHCGRFPQNSAKMMLPTQIPIKHLGWADSEERKKKYERYMRVDPEGKNGILQQYKSILDENPNLIEFGKSPI